jgi:CRISPR/Cas system CSM-associated protein Csm3 (group 7 of RAMP superfamily)
MPRGESFWNPYNWVPVADQEPGRARPLYHHRWQGVAGRLHCTLEALTPLLIGDGHGQFIRRKLDGKPFLPGTSLKGSIRSLVELIGNAASPFPNSQVDERHQLGRASSGNGSSWQLDTAARMFGFLTQGRVFAGLVRFGDGELIGDFLQPLSFKVAGGAPDPDHRSFYPTRSARKFYHHKTGTDSLTPPHPGIKADQQRQVRPLRPGTKFTFKVDFENLRDDELGLLLYCLALEEQVTVTLSKEALATGTEGPVTLKGPLRHKLGGCKPQGAGSVHIRIERLELRANPADRYRGERAATTELTGEALQKEIQSRTRGLRERDEPTMRHLRAMLIYVSDDPRIQDLNYPSYAWFQQDKQNPQKTPLKPVL